MVIHRPAFIFLSRTFSAKPISPDSRAQLPER